MTRRNKALPFVPTEIHVSTVEDEKGRLGILSIQTTEGILDLALDLTTADAIANAVEEIRSRLSPRARAIGRSWEPRRREV